MIRAEAQQLVRGTTVIVVTPSSDVKWVVAARQMERAGLRVVAIIIDGATFGGEEGSAALALQLTSAGAMTYLIKRNDSLEQVLSHKQGYQW